MFEKVAVTRKKIIEKEGYSTYLFKTDKYKINKNYQRQDALDVV